jgi:hypothetical protein
MTPREARIGALAAGMLADMRAHRYGHGIAAAVASGEMDAIAARVWEIEAWEASLARWHAMRQAHLEAFAAPRITALVDALARGLAAGEPELAAELVFLPGRTARSIPRPAVVHLNLAIAVLAEAVAA